MNALVKTKPLITRLPEKNITPFDQAATEAWLHTQMEKAHRAIATARDLAIGVGAKLLEVKEHFMAGRAGHSNQHTPKELQFKSFLEKIADQHDRDIRTLFRWMGAAEGARLQLADAAIDISSMSVPLSVLLTMPEDELPDGAREARQMLFAWMEERTMRQCYEGVVIDGDDSHRIKRAHNGKTKGGSGGDRKAFDEFIGRKLSDVSTHLGHWEDFTAGQKDQTFSHFANHFSKWPTAALEQMQKLIKEEMRKR